MEIKYMKIEEIKIVNNDPSKTGLLPIDYPKFCIVNPINNNDFTIIDISPTIKKSISSYLY